MEKVYIIPYNDINNLVEIVLKLAKLKVYNDNLIMKDTNESIVDYILALFMNKELPNINKFIKYLKLANISKNLIKSNIREQFGDELYTKISPVKKKLKKLNWISIDE